MNPDSIQEAQKWTANTVSEQMKCHLIFRNGLKCEFTEIVLDRLHSVIYHRLRKHGFILVTVATCR
jgi:hypothetical protein